MKLTDVLNLQFVQNEIERVREEEETKALAARNDILDRIREQEALEEELRAEVDLAEKRLKEIEARYQDARKAVALVENKAVQATSARHALERKLREHGERPLVDAEMELNARLQWLDREIARLDGIKEQVIEVASGYRRKVRNEKAALEAEQLREQRAAVARSHGEVLALFRARLSPRTLQDRSARSLEVLGTKAAAGNAGR